MRTWSYSSDNSADHQRCERHRSNGQVSRRTEQVIDPARKDGRVQTVDGRHASQQRKAHSLQHPNTQPNMQLSSLLNSGCDVDESIYNKKLGKAKRLARPRPGMRKCDCAFLTYLQTGYATST